MKYKGYELLKAIADGEIKNGSKFIFRVNQDVKNIYWNGENFKYISNKRNIMVDYADVELVNGTFELIEDEIDIDSIQKIELRENSGCEIINEDNIKLLFKQQNEILQAVKQLNKKVKELENEIK